VAVAGTTVALEAVAANVGKTTTPGSTAMTPQAAKKIVNARPISSRLNFCFMSISLLAEENRPIIKFVSFYECRWR
jgi:hypothetical protein